MHSPRPILSKGSKNDVLLICNGTTWGFFARGGSAPVFASHSRMRHIWGSMLVWEGYQKFGVELRCLTPGNIRGFPHIGAPIYTRIYSHP